MSENPYEKYLKRLNYLSKVYTDLKGNFDKAIYHSPSEIIALPDTIAIKINHIYDLSVARHTWKSTLGSWADRQASILNTYRDRILVTWIYSKHLIEPVTYEIWLRTTVDLFPKELLPSEDCHFEKIKDPTEPLFRLVCPSNNN